MVSPAPARAAFGLLILIAPLCLLVTSCEDDTILPHPPPVLSTPEAVVEQLQESYRRREISLYAALLAPEFRFYFQPVDAARFGEEYWTANQDSSGTDALFRTNLVSTIRIELVYGSSEVPTEAGFDPDVRKIWINHVKLEVDQTNGTTLFVTDIQDMYFRPGRQANGEDPDRWYLLEWRDIPAAGAPKPQTQSTTWGSIKGRY